VSLLAVLQEGGEATALVVGVVVAAVPTVIGWLLVRSVRGVDRNMDTMNAKLDQLVKSDTGRQVEITDLRARVVTLEYLVLGKRKTEGA
jgi:low affinity Fe/Cu permease